MNFTQFFGAFNDNLFKQLVLLICVNYGGRGHDYQTYAQALFALPFVLFSGFAGFLADRISKQRIVVAMKLAEIAVMTAGFFASAQELAVSPRPAQRRRPERKADRPLGPWGGACYDDFSPRGPARRAVRGPIPGV